MRRDHGRWATAGGLLAIVLWSVTVALARSLSEALGPLTAASAVYLAGGAFCLPRLWTRRTRAPKGEGQSWKYRLGCGSLFVLYTVLLYVGVGWARDREQALEVGLLNYLWPALTILFSLSLLKKRARWWLGPGTVLALAGVFMAMTSGAALSWQSFVSHCRSAPLAFLSGLLAAITWALYSNLTRRWSREGRGGAVEWFIPVTGLVLLAASGLSREAPNWTQRALVETILLGAVTALAYGLWERAMREGNLLLVAASSYFTPFLSTCVSCAYLGVMPGPRLWFGCALIVAGSLISWRSVSDSRDGREPEGC